MTKPIPEQQPPLTFPPGRTFPWVSTLLGIVCLSIVLAIVGSIKAKVKDQSSAAIAVGNGFIDALGSHNYDAAHSLVAFDVRNSLDASSLKDMETRLEKQYGAFVSHGQPQWNVGGGQGEGSMLLTYSVWFAKRDTTMVITLAQTEKGYKVYDYYFNP